MRKTGKHSARGEVGAKKGEPPRVSLYSEITNRIIADLERGCVPWVKPWGRANAALGRSPVLLKASHSLNLFLIDQSII